MEEYKPNSNRYKMEQAAKQEATPEKKIDKVVSNDVQVKKKSWFKKLTDSFVEDDGQTLSEFIWNDLMVPAIKKLIIDTISGILYGGTGYGSSPTVASRVGYASKFKEVNRDRSSLSPRTGFELDEIIFATRGEAEEVLIRLDELIETYRIASVADFYDLAGVSGSYTANKYGWTDIRSARVIHAGNGWAIRFPKALPLD